MSEYKLVPIKSTEEMIEAARSARPYIDDDEDELKDRNSEMTWDAMVAVAPAQEAEPVAWINMVPFQIENGDVDFRAEMSFKQEYHHDTPLYTLPLTAEQAAADMKRRCVDIVKNWRRVHALEECCDHAQYVALSEVEKLIESLPTSDTAMEEIA